jgi:hypothetical protein
MGIMSLIILGWILSTLNAPTWVWVLFIIICVTKGLIILLGGIAKAIE